MATWKSPLLLFAALVVVVGWILAWRRPKVLIGWLLLGFGAIGSLQGPATLLARLLTPAHPVAAGWALEFGAESTWSWIPSLGILLGLIPLRFPAGALPSPRWRWFWWLSVAVLVIDSLFATTPTASMVSTTMTFSAPNPTFVDWPPGVTAVAEPAVQLSLLGIFVGSVISLVVRYRRGGSIERAQLRWFFWAVAIVVLLLVVSAVESAMFGAEESGGVTGLVAHLFDSVNTLSYCLIPISIMVAVLRSGLYTIDRLISRTVSYGLMTLTVVVLYIAVVLVGSSLFPRLQNEGVAIATLAVAALAWPLLRFLRRLIDRRFNREQYDAQKVVEAFGDRIRSGADPHRAGDDFIASVQLALQPTAIGIWLREDTQRQ